MYFVLNFDSMRYMNRSRFSLLFSIFDLHGSVVAYEYFTAELANISLVMFFAWPTETFIFADLLPVYKAQSLVVSPVQLSDLDTELFKRLFERATKVAIDFFGRAATEEKSGYKARL